MGIKILGASLKDSRIETIKNIKNYFDYLSSIEAKKFMDDILSGTLEQTLDDHYLYSLNKIFDGVKYEELMSEKEISEKEYWEKSEKEYWEKREKELKEANDWYESLNDIEKGHVNAMSRYNAPIG